MAEREIVAPGLPDSLRVHRDRFGVPHVDAKNSTDAWFGLGFACATDRMWQMEKDRRLAVGRWSEVVGDSAVSADRLSRRLRLGDVARSTVDAMSAPTRLAFEAYANGINAYLASAPGLPAQYEEQALMPEPWEPWHSVAAYRIRHIFKGTWPLKIVQAQLLVAVGPDTYAKLDSRAPWGTPLLEPETTAKSLVARAIEDLRDASAELGWLAAATGGSNAWAIAGSRTTSGQPILCNDSHRDLEFPNVYWQAHVRCPQFDVAGATFPGLPGFPNFGHNGHVAWAVTHGMADSQDLYVERFDDRDSERYRVPGGWALADVRSEVLRVRNAPDFLVETWATRHGPIVHGDPRSGLAIALQDSALSEFRSLEGLELMLQARTVRDLMESQRDWVDPIHNLVCADTSGDIGYLLRGLLPVRSTDRHRQFPVRGWTGESEWVGQIRFEDMPRLLNPARGFIASANQPVLTTDEPYVADSFVEPYRAERIVELLGKSGSMKAAQAADIQTDTTSTAARRWARFLRRRPPLDGNAELARKLLSEWDANLSADSSAALLYACFRRRVAEVIYGRLVGAEQWAWLASGREPASETLVTRWLANVVSALDSGADPPNGSSWAATLQDALGSAWADAIALAGEEPDRWRWADVHRLVIPPAQSRAPSEGEGRLHGSPVGVAGDGDTINATSYGIGRGGGGSFDVALVAVYRQVVDLSDPWSATSVIPGGASGDPRSEHYLDQLTLWAEGRRIPMQDSDR